jgi:hypothetical protein
MRRSLPLLALLLPSLALAEDAVPDPGIEEPAPEVRFVTVTGGVDSGDSIVELTGEVAVGPRHAMAFTWGIAPNTPSRDQLSASYRYSLLGDFDTGVLVGGELTTIGANGWGAGFGAAAFGGGKYTAPFGLTTEALLGGQVRMGEPYVLATLAVGWSFGSRPKLD